MPGQGLAPGNAAVMVCCSAGAGGKAPGTAEGGGGELHTPLSALQWPGSGLVLSWAGAGSDKVMHSQL